MYKILCPTHHIPSSPPVTQTENMDSLPGPSLPSPSHQCFHRYFQILPVFLPKHPLSPSCSSLSYFCLTAPGPGYFSPRILQQPLSLSHCSSACSEEHLEGLMQHDKVLPCQPRPNDAPPPQDKAPSSVIRHTKSS